MVVVEMGFRGQGGLGSLVLQAADAVEQELDRAGLAWSEKYPITLRESLGLALQQLIVGGHGRSLSRGPQDRVYRVWLGLPEGGLKAWAAGVAARVLEGCQAVDKPLGREIGGRLQAVLVAQLEPCLDGETAQA
jgi:hypothetical protein